MIGTFAVLVAGMALGFVLFLEFATWKMHPKLNKWRDELERREDGIKAKHEELRASLLAFHEERDAYVQHIRLEHRREIERLTTWSGPRAERLERALWDAKEAFGAWLSDHNLAKPESPEPHEATP